MKIGEAVSHPSYNAVASAAAKRYIVAFFAFCAVIAYLDHPTLGLWWIAVLLVGMFVASVLFAMPVTGAKLLLATKFGIVPDGVGKLLYRAIEIAGYIALWFATRYVINAISA